MSKEVNIKKNMNKLRIKFIGTLDWINFRNLLVLKLQECSSEEELSKLFEQLLSSMFNSVKELDTTRKKLRIKQLTEIEKKKMNKILKEKT